MKRLCILLVLTLLLGCMAGCGSSQIKIPTAAAPETPAATQSVLEETDAPALAADALPDFTVATVSGDTFTLSEALKTHELVLINLFATWCGYCKIEFPYLEEAWEQARDRVSVIALSIEPTDTADALRDFAKELGLKFPVAREEGADLSGYAVNGVPTTLVVDRTGRVVAVEVGAKGSTQEFLDLFDNFTGADYDPNLCTYTVGAYDASTYEFVGGLVVTFCTDNVCMPVTTSEDGPVDFTGAPAVYHMQVVQLPDGWEVVGESDFYTETYGQTFWIPLTEAG